jgi:O-antigen/teichoic acid export membrane protein
VGAVAQNIILARVLPIQAYGLLSAILSAGMFAFVISDFGTGISVCRLQASRDRQGWKEEYRKLWTIRILLSGAAVCVVVPIAMARFPEATVLVTFVLASELFRSVAHFIGMAARGAGNVRSVVILTLCDRWGTLGCSSVIVLMGGGLEAIGVAYFIPRLIALALGLRWIREAGLPMRFSETSRRLFNDLRAVSPIGILLVSDKIVFYSMPLLIALLGSTIDVAMFQASMKISLLPISICSALVGAYFPDFVKEAIADRPPGVAVGVYGLVSVLCAPVVALCLLSPQVPLRVLFGTTFEAAAGCLRVMAGFIVLNIAHQFSVHLLPAYGREGILGRSASSAAAVCVAIALALVPANGAVGAAIAVAMYAVVALVPNATALRGAWRLQLTHRDVIVSSWVAAAGCFGATGALMWLSVEPVVFLCLWSVVSLTIVVGFAYRQREAIRSLFVSVKSAHSMREVEQESLVRLG